MTPEQRREAVRKGITDIVRGSMNRMGYTDAAMQDDVLAYAFEEEDALQVVRDKHREVVTAIMANPNDDETIVKLMADLRAAIEEAKEKRTATIKALDAKIDFSSKPRLEAFLSLSGITGDESLFIAGIFGNIMSAMSNAGQNRG